MKRSDQLKAYCIEQYIGFDRSVYSISKDLGIPSITIRDWINEFWFGKPNRWRKNKDRILITKTSGFNER